MPLTSFIITYFIFNFPITHKKLPIYFLLDIDMITLYCTLHIMKTMTSLFSRLSIVVQIQIMPFTLYDFSDWIQIMNILMR